MYNIQIHKRKYTQFVCMSTYVCYLIYCSVEFNGSILNISKVNIKKAEDFMRVNPRSIQITIFIMRNQLNMI